MLDLTQEKAEKRRQQLLDTAVTRWRKAVKEMGLNGTALRSGLRSIDASSRPGNAVTNLIRQFRGRAVQAIETSPMANPSHVEALRAKLYRARGNVGWFPSDPQGMALLRLERMVGDGLTKAEFDDMARTIAAMKSPHKKWLFDDEKRGFGSFNERDPVRVIPCPDHMRRIRP